jgi:mannose-6-phosphate isomerase-like protein (cupin superfamily)
MERFPEFMRSAANRIAANSQATTGVEGYLFDGADGSQAAFWTCHDTAVQASPHVHEFDEYLIVIQGHYTLIFDDNRVSLGPGKEYVIPKGVRHGGEAIGGTRLISVFGGRRAEREREAK